MADLSILDENVPDLVKAAANLSLADVREILAAEQADRARITAIRSLEELIAGKEALDAVSEPSEDEPETGEEPVEDEEVPEEVPSGSAEVENIIPGSDITLHDGSHLLFGEKAAVPGELAAAMRKNKQVR